MSHSDQTRNDILNAALKIAPFEGWTTLTLKRAVREAGYPEGSDELYFENGIGEILDFWSTRLNSQAETKIQALDLTSLKIRDRVTQGVLARLDQIWESADMIWRAIGDTSTDANYYSKRVILSSVIAATLPIWLSDASEDKQKAKDFLDARIANVMQFEKMKWQVKSATKDLPNPAEILGQIRYGGLDILTRPKKGRARRRRYSR